MRRSSRRILRNTCARHKEARYKVTLAVALRSGDNSERIQLRNPCHVRVKRRNLRWRIVQRDIIPGFEDLARNRTQGAGHLWAIVAGLWRARWEIERNAVPFTDRLEQT